LGRAWGRDEIRSLLDDLALSFEDLGSARESVDRAADELAEGGVLAWFEGGFEWGPRSLGHRSILADPRRVAMRDTVNAKIKFREQFRPFAPAVLEDQADDWFILHPAERTAARFMMTAAPVREEVRDRIPATTHVDGTARVQLVFAESTPVFHALLTAFAEKTGVPVLLNTSLNLKGEPIAGSPVDALATLMRCGLDALYIEGFRVERSKRLTGEQAL
jgi:carbamoyltransferase